MPSIFISYAREDIAIAQRLRADLVDLGMSPWLDVEDLLPGSRWKPAIEKAIRGADFFIALLSSYSVAKRGYVQREVREAIDVLRELPDNRVFLIPVRLENCKPEVAELEDLHWVDLFPDYSTGLNRIVSVLRSGEKSGFLRPQFSPTERTEGFLTSRIEAPAIHGVVNHEYFTNSVWRETIETGLPQQIDINFKSDGSFTFRYNESDVFRPPSKGGQWSIRDGVLELNWNEDFCIDSFILPPSRTEQLEGIQSVGSKKIVFSKIA